MKKIAGGTAFLLICFTSLMGVSPPPAAADSRHIAQEDQIKHLKSQLDELRTVDMRVTAYALKHSEKGKMGRVVAGRTCAISRDRTYMLGRTVNVPGVGLRRVNDLMAEGKVNSLDLAMGSKKVARKWGVKKRKVTFLD